jgi:predicted ATPase/transcriptional regulator with XRE-family HTH domain
VPEDQVPPFAALLRRRRYAAALTQEELARRARVGVRTLRDLETARARRPHKSTVDLLATALNLKGAERDEFMAFARGLPASGHGRTPHVSLPPATALFGRDDTVRDVASLLDVAGLVTLVGLAGVGKTALVLTIAHRVAQRYTGGVCGIAITEASTIADELAVVASLFGAGRADLLPGRIETTGPALLVVDGVDRYAEVGIAVVSWLRTYVPRLRMLAASRHPLGLPDEHQWPVPPLEVPPPEATGADVFSYAAAAMFLDRLRRVRRRRIAEDEAAVLGALVRRLGGVPFALELAAARGRVLELSEMLSRYGDGRLDLGAGDPSVLSLRDAVAASWRLLEPGEQVCLQWLAAFRWRWSLELAEDLLEGEPARALGTDVVAYVDRLVALGLVSVRSGGDQLRFRLFDVVHDFALERSADSGLLPAARDRHAAVVAALVARIAPELAGPASAAAALRLAYLTSDLRAALVHTAENDPRAALRLALDLVGWWRLHGRESEARESLRKVLDDPRNARRVDATLRKRARAALADLEPSGDA